LRDAISRPLARLRETDFERPAVLDLRDASHVPSPAVAGEG
jgi:hypothetical protein